jgi:hypothetical protein
MRWTDAIGLAGLSMVVLGYPVDVSQFSRPYGLEVLAGRLRIMVGGVCLRGRVALVALVGRRVTGEGSSEMKSLQQLLTKSN